MRAAIWTQPLRLADSRAAEAYRRPNSPRFSFFASAPVPIEGFRGRFVRARIARPGVIQRHVYVPDPAKWLKDPPFERSPRR